MTSAALDKAIKQTNIFSTVVNGQLSYRKCDKKVCIEDDCKNRYTQTDTGPIKEQISKKDSDPIQEDLDELKIYAHGEILLIKADVANKLNPHSPEAPIRIDYNKEDLVRCLQECILSFEKQLQDK